MRAYFDGEGTEGEEGNGEEYGGKGSVPHA